jgi:hypothetical protein
MRQSVFDRVGSRCGSVPEGLAARGLDYNVEKVALFNNHGEQVPATYGLRATKEGQGFMLKGSVGVDYRTVQHREALSLASDWVGAGEAKLVSVGSLPNHGAFALLALPKLDVDAEGRDPIQWSVILRSSHGASNVAILTSQQIWCLNQLPRLSKGAGTVRLRHSGNVEDKLAQMSQVLRQGVSLMEEEAFTWRELRNRRMSQADMTEVLENWIGKPRPEATERQKENFREIRGQVLLRNTLNEGTAMGALDRITSYLDHARARYTRSKEMAQALAASSLDGETERLRRRGLELVLQAS